MKLNEPSLKYHPDIPGVSVADQLFASISTVILMKNHLNLLSSVMLTILANVSPYIRRIAEEPSTLFVNLLEWTSS